MRRSRPVGRTAAARLLLAFALAGAAGGEARAQGGADPLPSWNEGPAKAAIIAFVRRTTTPGSPDFVPVADRVASFDNDGTLWPEKPLPVEVYFVLERLRELAARDPSMKERQPFKAALEGDAAYFHAAGARALTQLLAATHSGRTQEEFAREVERFLADGRHPVLKRRFTATAYQPMRELLAYLDASGFQTWLCSGGTLDFIRELGPRMYGIPAERAIGSELERETRRVGGKVVVYRLPRIEMVNDGDGKPLGLDAHVGRRPLLAAGNVMSGGDVAMLEYSRGRGGPSLQLLVNHDDDAREFAYAERDGASLRAAERLGFVVVSVRRDWRQVFAPESGDAYLSRRE